MIEWMTADHILKNTKLLILSARHRGVVYVHGQKMKQNKTTVFQRSL